MNIWIPLIGDESLICRKEKGNEYDPHAVAITRNNVVVGHVRQNICNHFWKFLSLPKTSIRARVLGKTVSRSAGYGLEIPSCMLYFSRPYQRNSMGKEENQRWFNLALKNA